MKKLAILVSLMGAVTVMAQTAGQFIVPVKTAGGRTETGVTLANGEVIGKSGGVPAAISLSSYLTSASALSATNLTSGTLPVDRLGAGSITLSKLAASGATSGQVATWNGSAWVPATPSGGGGAGLDNIASSITGGTLTLSGTLTTGRTLTVRDLAGTIALTSDLSAYLTTSSAASTYASLSGSYSNPAWITGLAWSKITGTPTTLAGYGITDAITAATAASAYASLSGSYSNPAWITGLAWSKITGTPTTLAGYGITDAITAATAASTYASLSGSYSNPAWITGLAWSKITGTPTTLAGYGITDAITAATAASTYASLSGSYADPAWITSLDWTKLASVPAPVSTLGGLADAAGVLTNNGAGLYQWTQAPTFEQITVRPAMGIEGQMAFQYVDEFNVTSTIMNFSWTTTPIIQLFNTTTGVYLNTKPEGWQYLPNTGFYTEIGFVPPTADRELLFPDESGIVLTSGSTGAVTSTIILNGTIVAADIADATITNAKLAGSIAASKLIGTDIATVGTITAGTWQGSIIAPAYLGTGTSITTKYLRGDGTWQTIPGGGDALTSSPLSQFAATTSSQFAGVISDETGTGAVVFASSPALTTPNLGTPSAATLTNATGLPLSTGVTGTLPIANGGTGQTSQTAAFDALAPTTTKGDLIVSNGSDNIRVPVGATNGHVLTVDSAEASGMKWAAGSGGGTKNWVLISTTTISGNPSTLTFTLSGSYRGYMLQFENVYCSSSGYGLRLRTSTDGGTTFDSGTANYGYAYNAMGTYGPIITTNTFMEILPISSLSNSTDGVFGCITFFDPLNASLKAFAEWKLYGRRWNSANPDTVVGTGYRDTAADVDTLQLYWSAGTFGGGKVRLFGWSE